MTFFLSVICFVIISGDDEDDDDDDGLQPLVLSTSSFVLKY